METENAMPRRYPVGIQTFERIREENYLFSQVKCARGRADLVVWMPDAIYVIEIKLDRTAQEALEQIDAKGYAIPYQTDGRRVVKAGVNFSTETKTLTDWVICN